jgi:hypothetical protein
MKPLPSVKLHFTAGHTSPAIYRFKRFEQAVVRACVGVAIFVCALITADFACGDELRCPGRNVVVHSAARGDAETACEAAGEAIDFLAAQGFDTTGAVKVNLVRKIPVVGLPTIGCYDHPHRRVYVLVFSEFLKLKTWSELPVDRTLYKSLVAHEVAHAVAAANFSVPKPSILAEEYIAYVTQLATMPLRYRERVLEQSSGEGYDSANEMTVTFYLISPFRFGVNAYRHFLKPGNGESFLKGVLSGRVLIGEGYP